MRPHALHPGAIQGKEGIKFCHLATLFRYGGPPDDKLARPYDAFLGVRMASIIYVHTHRFYSEVLSFFNQFHQLQSVMNRIREAAAGGMVKELAARGTRLKLDIEAGSPLLILPMSSNSPDIVAVGKSVMCISDTIHTLVSPS